jgi:DNA-binding MarR family transcriptional regulator
MEMPMTTTVPAADSRTLALAHYAARGVLEHVLSRHGITFQQHVTLRTAATAQAPLTPTELVTEVRGYLKADPADLRATLEELVAKHLLITSGAHLCPTDEGREVLAAAATDTAPFATRIWGGVPADDLAVAGRVLAVVAERANAELAALTA